MSPQGALRLERDTPEWLRAFSDLTADLPSELLYISEEADRAAELIRDGYEPSDAARIMRCEDDQRFWFDIAHNLSEDEDEIPGRTRHGGGCA